MAHNKLVPELDITDYQASLDFYIDILGFNIVYQRIEEGFVYLEREGAELMLDDLNKGRSFATADRKPPFGRGINLQIEVSNVDTLYKTVRTTDAPIVLRMEEKWYRKDKEEVGNKQFVVQDPDGYLLRFFEDMGKRKIK